VAGNTRLPNVMLNVDAASEDVEPERESAS
jgi:hypothetical protein